MGIKQIENENHVLFECDLYADLRAKLITKLNKSTPRFSPDTNEPQHNLVVNIKNIKKHLMQLLSPYITSNFNEVPVDSYNAHHKLLLNKNTKLITNEIESLLYRRSYIVNCVCTFICHTLEKRQKHLKNVQENPLPNIIVINFQ